MLRHCRTRLQHHRPLRRCQGTSAPQAERQVFDTDVLVVGGGPAGLAAAIKLRQLAQSTNPDLSVSLIDKGAHILSGAVLEPRAFNELFPDWHERHGPNCSDAAPLVTPALIDQFKFLTEKRAWSLPTVSQMRNHGNWIVSLSEVTRWMGRQAEALGVNIFAGFAGAEVLYGQQGEVVGVATNDLGISKSGVPKANFERGMAIRARLTLFAEGAHGSLSKQLIKKFNLRQDCQHQTYGIGLKEVWQIPKEKHRPGLVLHTVGWPLDSKTYGGSFMYHYGEDMVSLGLVIGLDYRNPYLNPYKELQRLKMHPKFRKLLDGGQCLAYGARVLNEGGWQSIPKLYFPGGALIGCSAGFVNILKIKGIHTAMKSGMIAAESAMDALQMNSAESISLKEYEQRLKDSWVYDELKSVRNIRPAMHRFGMYGGILYSGIDSQILRGMAPWNFKHGLPDYAALEPAANHKPIEYPKADDKLTFGLLDNLSRTGTKHEEDQPCHLQLEHTSSPQLDVNLPIFAGPEERFCPAGVYEYLEDAEGNKRFQINAQNCIHCKTCDIKDPSQNINWSTPEGGGGPNYSMT